MSFQNVIVIHYEEILSALIRTWVVLQAIHALGVCASNYLLMSDKIVIFSILQPTDPTINSAAAHIRGQTMIQ